MAKNIVHLCDGLKPGDVKYKKGESVKSIISDFIKYSEKKFPADRQHVNNMVAFDGTNDIGYKAVGDYGFFAAIFECYNNHWALRTIPDDWWYTIIRTVAMAIDKNSKKDEVRKFFVDHEGKKRLTVDVESINPVKIDYEDFFRQMTDLIQSNIKVDGYVDTIRSDFSTSTLTHRIVSEITVMSSMQEFFEYCARTCCGIPYVEILGSNDDWVQLKTKFLRLKEILKPIDGLIGLDNWWERAEIICDKLIETSQGNVDKEWWKYVFSMKRHGMGSGSFTTYDGWFLRDLLNISRIESFRSLPSGLVSVPLVFDDNGCESEGAIVSGISGIKIDESKDVPIVESIHGWAIFQ